MLPVSNLPIVQAKVRTPRDPVPISNADPRNRREEARAQHGYSAFRQEPQSCNRAEPRRIQHLYQAASVLRDYRVPGQL